TAMEWRGIDPASSRVLLDEEAKLVGFVDTPELLAADLDFEDDADEEDSAGDEYSPDDDDAWPLLDREADRLGQPFLDGSRPDFKRGSLDERWGWAVTQYSPVGARTRKVELGTAVLLPARRNPVVLPHGIATLD